MVYPSENRERETERQRESLTWIKLYHAIIKQILLYGSEIWGPVIHFKEWDKTSIEKLQLEMIKNILGVCRCTSNDACRAVLALYPLKIEIQKRCVQFKHHLHQSDPDSVQYKKPSSPMKPQQNLIL